MKRNPYLTNIDICSGCGTCISLCKNKALKIELNSERGVYYPKVDISKCDDCSFCQKICPVSDGNIIKLSEKIFGRKITDILVGNILGCYTGYSTSQRIRYESASGGLITQLLIFALERKLIDGALVTKMKEGSPLRTESFIARTKDEILEASKSKYCPTPANVALIEILKRNGKYAVVGLPCHIRGIRRAELHNRELRERIVLHLGLFCHHTPNFWATEILLKRMNIKSDDVVKLDYRGGGWPGFMNIKLKNGRNVSIDLQSYWRFLGLDFFISRGCLLCTDCLNELADISFGDAWLPEFSKDNMGTSMIVVRSNIGMKILKNAEFEGYIKLSKINVKKVIQSQLDTLYLKKKVTPAYINLSRRKVRYDNALDPDVLEYLLAIFRALNNQIFMKRAFMKCLIKVPTWALHAYYLVPNFIIHKEASKLLRKL